MFHEAGHSTGHPSRLARPGIMEGHRFGDDAYSQEELVAEFTAAYLCGTVGIDPETSIGNSAAYIAGWAAKLRADAKLVVYAAAQAQRSADRVQRLDFAAAGTIEPAEDAAA